MSADAKAWTDARGRWHAIHDGECSPVIVNHEGDEYELSDVLKRVETCLGGAIRWQFRSYANGLVGLVGYIS